VEAAHENLLVGAVLRFYNYVATPNKDKYVIIVGQDRTRNLLSYVFVNSEVNLSVFPTTELQNLQYWLLASEINKLEYSSYVDCSEIHEHDIEDIRQKMIDNTEVHIGQLENSDFEKIIKLIASSRKISLADKRRYSIV